MGRCMKAAQRHKEYRRTSEFVEMHVSLLSFLPRPRQVNFVQTKGIAMSDFIKALEAGKQDFNAKIEIDRLAELVESQISNVIGGGYSQYEAKHKEDVQAES